LASLFVLLLLAFDPLVGVAYAGDADSGSTAADVEVVATDADAKAIDEVPPAETAGGNNGGAAPTEGEEGDFSVEADDTTDAEQTAADPDTKAETAQAGDVDSLGEETVLDEIPISNDVPDDDATDADAIVDEQDILEDTESPEWRWCMKPRQNRA